MTMRTPDRGTRARRGKPYASGLDGIRALAVACVVLYHAGVPGFRGGFVGVDLFFVVSGYLVTALLQREHDRTGRIAIGEFFRRRAVRLLPALVLMLVVVSAATLALGRDLGAGLREQLLSAVTFSSNIVQVATGSSYVSAREPAVFTHLWSLAVEEQFYLLWPAVCLFLLVRVGRRHRRAALVAGGAAVSAALMALLYRSGADPTRVYVGTDTHGFGLLLGAALAFSRPSSAVDPAVRKRSDVPRGASRFLGPVALITVLAAVVGLGDTSPLTFRGGLMVVNLAAVALVAATIRAAGPLARMFGHPALRGLGLRSYSLYLWHWPALVIAQRVFGMDSGHVWPAVVGLVAAGLATEVSWRLVEDPVRRLGPAGYLRAVRHRLLGRPILVRRRSAAWTAVGGLTLAVAIAACGVVVAPTESEVSVSLAAGEQALEQASAARSAPGATPLVSSSAAAHSLSAESDATEPGGSAAPGGSALPGGSAPSGNASPASGSAAPVGSSEPSTPSTHARAVPKTRAASAPTAAPTSAPAMPPTTRATNLHGRTVQAPVAPKTAARPPVSGADLTAIGDSVMLASAPALLNRFPGADIDAVVSRQLWDLGALLAPKMPHLRHYLLVGLGTNGTDAVAHIQAALAQVPASEVVVLVNSFVPQSW